MSEHRNTVLKRAPILFWPLNDANGAIDLSGAGKNGTLGGGMTVGGWADSPIIGESNSTDFDGLAWDAGGDVVRHDTYAAPWAGQQLSVSLWAWRDTSDTLDGLVCANNPYPNIPYLAVNTGTNDVLWSPQHNVAVATTWSGAWPGPGCWVHVGLAWDMAANLVSLYIDGSLVSTQTQTGNYNATTPTGIRLGNQTTLAGYYDGKMTNFALFGAVLTALDFRELYDSGVTGQPSDHSLTLQANGDASPTALMQGPMGYVAKEGLELPIPDFDNVYAEGPDTEGGPMVRSTPQNAIARIEMWLTGYDEDDFWTGGAQWQALINRCNRKGGELIYRGATGEAEAVIYDVIAARITEMLQDHVMARQERGRSTAELTCLPYGRLSERDQNLSIVDSFNYNSITNQDWLFDTGSGTLDVSGGQLVPSTTAQKLLYRYGTVVEDGTAYLKFTAGASVATLFVGIVLKRVDADNFLLLQVDDAGSGNAFSIFRYDAPTYAALQATTHPALLPGQSYWLKFAIAGNVCTGTLYATDPNGANPSDAIATVTHALTGNDATERGIGIWGNPGIRIGGQGTDWRYDDFRVDAPAVRSTKPLFECWALDVPGSAPALPRFELDDIASQERRFVEVGADSHQDSEAPIPVLFDSDSFYIATFPSTQATGGTGAYNPKGTGNTHVDLNLTTNAQYVARLETIGPGTWRVKARVQTDLEAATAGVFMRMEVQYPAVRQWPWVQLVVGGSAWEEVDLGVFHNPAYLPGASVAGEMGTWARVVFSAYAAVPASGSLWVDYAKVVPAENYGKASAPTPGVVHPTEKFSWRHDFGGQAYYGIQRPFTGSYLRLNPGDTHLSGQMRRVQTDAGAADTPINDGLEANLRISPRVFLLGESE